MVSQGEGGMRTASVSRGSPPGLWSSVKARVLDRAHADQLMSSELVALGELHQKLCQHAGEF